MNRMKIDERIIKERKIRAKKVLKILEKLFPNARIALRYKNNWELLVAVELSAQCTDKMVNKVTEKLFKKYKTLDDYVKANPREFETDIRSTGFYRNKTKNILSAAKIIKKKYNGRVPDEMEELLTIPGVARKTANVVLGNAFGKVEGIAVDTHVKRLAQKLGLTAHSDANKIEKDLMEIFQKKEWFLLTYRLIEYGRHVCPARVHDCAGHPLTKIYPRAGMIWPRAK